MTYQWVKAVHIFGFLLWTGSLAGCLLLLQGHARAGSAAAALAGMQRRTAIFMDIGATIALAAGFYLALGFPPINAFKDGAWLHVKSTLVVVGLVGIHVFTRIKVRKFRNGSINSLPNFVIPLTLILVAAIVVLAVVKPMR